MSSRKQKNNIEHRIRQLLFIRDKFDRVTNIANDILSYHIINPIDTWTVTLKDVIYEDKPLKYSYTMINMTQNNKTHIPLDLYLACNDYNIIAVQCFSNYIPKIIGKTYNIDYNIKLIKIQLKELNLVYKKLKNIQKNNYTEKNDNRKCSKKL